MKIAHIVCAYPPYFGGMGNSVYSLVNELENMGHETAVFTIGESTDIQQHDVRGRVHRYAPLLKHGNAAYIPQIRQYLDDFDIVHLHYPFYGVANMVRTWKKKNPEKGFVLTYHMDTQAISLKGLYFLYYTKFSLPKILGVADARIRSSKDYIQTSNAAVIERSEPEKWHYIPFGVDTQRFYPKDSSVDLQERFGLGDESIPTILFVGGMDDAHYFKGIDVLLRALRILARKNVSFRAIMVGDGNLKESYELKAFGMGIKKHVHFVGHVDDEVLPDFYNLADVFVLPSINTSEAFGMVLLEAMASGVPVIASDLPGVRTIAKNGGGVFPVGDYEVLSERLIHVLNYSDQKKEHVGQDIQHVIKEKYSWEGVAKKHETVYMEIVAKMKK